MSAQRAQLPGARWHFQHGPMDVLVWAEGDARAVRAAHAAAWERFQTVLAELVGELVVLRQPVRPGNASNPLQGPVARRMWAACQPYTAEFVTPMVAVAGAVAQELIAFYAQPGITRAWVNNGGDIALHLAPGQSLQVGLYADMSHLPDDLCNASICVDGRFTVTSDMPVRGVATSGWRGRSFSRGIADSACVLARTASQADAAASMIANAVNVADARIGRASASSLRDDSDLGDLLVTTAVPALEPLVVRQALAAGLARAQGLQAAGLIWSAALVCQGQGVTTPRLPLPQLNNQAHWQAEAQVGSVFA